MAPPQKKLSHSSVIASSSHSGEASQSNTAEHQNVQFKEYRSMKLKTGLSFEVVTNSVKTKEKVETCAGDFTVTVSTTNKPLKKKKHTTEHKKNEWFLVIASIKMKTSNSNLRQSTVVVKTMEHKETKAPTPDMCKAVIKKSGRVTSLLKLKFLRRYRFLKKAARFTIDIEFLDLDGDEEEDDSHDNGIVNQVVKHDLGRKLYESRFLTGDATIVAKDNSVFTVHQCVLAAQSQVINTHFRVLKKNDQEPILKVDCDSTTAINFVEFLYLGYTNAVVIKTKELLKLGHAFKLDHLMDECWRSLRKKLETENVIPLLLLADELGDGERKKKFAKYLLKNHETIRKTEAFAKFIAEHQALYLEICAM